MRKSLRMTDPSGQSAASGPQVSMQLDPFLILSMWLGISLLFVNPSKDGWFEWLYLPVASGYGLSLFEAVAIFVNVVVIVAKGFVVKPAERRIILALFLVLCSRAISIVLAQESTPDQFLSLLRYSGIAVLIIGSAGLFSVRSSRTAFVVGATIAALTEALGGMLITLSSSGEQRGILVSEGAYVVEAFIATLCLLVAAKRVNFVFPAGLGLVVIIGGVLASLTRTGMILAALSLALAYGYLAYSQRSKRYQMLLIGGGLATLVAGLCAVAYLSLPRVGQVIEERILMAFHGEGSVLERYYLWDRALAAFLEYPITGIGSGGFARQQASLPQLFGIESPYQYTDVEELPGVHNLVLGVASETGLAGLSAYAVWFSIVIMLSVRALKVGRSSSEVAPIAAAILLLALALSDFWASGSFLPSFSILAGFVLGWLRELRAAALDRNRLGFA